MHARAGAAHLHPSSTVRSHLHPGTQPPQELAAALQLQEPGMPVGSSGSSTQALQAAMHRVIVGGETTEPHHHHRLLLQRMEPLFRPAPPPTDRDRRLTRLLVNVTVDRSLWPVHLVLGADATVADLVRAAVHAYVREGRRPPLLQQPGAAADDSDAADGFELHLNKYSLQSLGPDEKVLDLGSRNFFLCARRPAAAAACGVSVS